MTINPVVLVFTARTAGAGQGPGRPYSHRHRPPPVDHRRSWHHLLRRQGSYRRKGHTWWADEHEGCLLPPPADPSRQQGTLGWHLRAHLVTLLRPWHTSATKYSVFRRRFRCERCVLLYSVLTFVVLFHQNAATLKYSLHFCNVQWLWLLCIEGFTIILLHVSATASPTIFLCRGHCFAHFRLRL